MHASDQLTSQPGNHIADVYIQMAGHWRVQESGFEYSDASYHMVKSNPNIVLDEDEKGVAAFCRYRKPIPQDLCFTMNGLTQARRNRTANRPHRQNRSAHFEHYNRTMQDSSGEEHCYPREIFLFMSRMRYRARRVDMKTLLITHILTASTFTNFPSASEKYRVEHIWFACMTSLILSSMPYSPDHLQFPLRNIAVLMGTSFSNITPFHLHRHQHQVNPKKNKTSLKYLK